MKTIYLLKKTHRKTGLKYLCKKETSDVSECFSYTGSGTYWKKHLKKCGNNFDTEIIYFTQSKNEFKKYARNYSIKYNIVESNEWANLCIEEGQGGNTQSIYENVNRERAQKISKSLKGKKFSESHKLSLRGPRPHTSGENNHFYGKKHGVETKKLISERKKIIQLGSNNSNARPVIFNNKYYGTMKDLSKSLCISMYEIRKMISNGSIRRA